MQGLLVQVLALRQLGRLTPRQGLLLRYRPVWAEVCPRTIHTWRLWGSSAFPGLRTHRPAWCTRDSASSWCVHQLRFRSNKKKRNAKTTQEEEDDEDEKDSDDSDSDDEVDDDPNLPKDYKDIEKYVQSFRYDVIMKAGLDMARNKVEDAFYSTKLRLNGQRLIKKSKAVKVGDTLDLVLSENRDTNTVTLMRVIVKKVLGESQDAEKYKVRLRRWKHVELPKADAFKS